MSESVKNFVNKMKQPNSDTFRVFIIVLTSIILIYLIYKFYNFIQWEKLNPRFIPKGKSASEFYRANGKKIVTTTNENEFTLFLWMYVDNINTKYGELKHIITKGSGSSNNSDSDYKKMFEKKNNCPTIEQHGSNSNSNSNQKYVNIGYYSRNQCPSLWIKPRTNDIKVVISTESKNDTFDIKDFPIRKWFSISVVIKGITVELYKNGLLTSSHPLSGEPLLNNSDLIINSRDGYDGAIQCVRWFSTALTSNTILNYHRIYKEPYFYQIIWDKITGMPMPKLPNIKINFNVDLNTGKETSKDAKRKKNKKRRQGLFSS